MVWLNHDTNDTKSHGYIHRSHVLKRQNVKTNRWSWNHHRWVEKSFGGVWVPKQRPWESNPFASKVIGSWKGPKTAGSNHHFVST